MSKEVVPNAELVRARKDGTAMLVPLGSDVADIQVTDEHSYVLADGVLTRILVAKKNWLGRVDPIIKPIYDALQLLYALRKDVLQPLETYEVAIKGKMRTYKLQESKRIREEQEAQALELERLRKEAELKEQRAAQAKTHQMRDRLETARAELEQKRAELEQKAPPAPVKAAGSSARGRKIAKVGDDRKLAEAILKGQVKLGEDTVDFEDLFYIQISSLTAAYRLDPDAVSKWPGIEIVDDVVIAGRG